MKPCPCGAEPTVSHDIHGGYCVYCSNCMKTLTEETYSYAEAILAWCYGKDKLPPCCPFCSIPVSIIDPAGPSPKVECVCLIMNGRQFDLEMWNSQARPKTYDLDALLKRWAKKPEFAKPMKALTRALNHYKTGRWWTKTAR